jgi:hypothetical protein
MRGFFGELQHRRVYRVALAYGVVASGLVQIGGTILPIFHVAEWVQQLFVVLIAVGFPFALVLAWAFDITKSGIERTPNVSGLYVSSRRQIWVLALMGTAIAALAFWRLRHGMISRRSISAFIIRGRGMKRSLREAKAITPQRWMLLPRRARFSKLA